MSDLASWLKALHIVAFTAWMAGLWYLPRLFVYHSQVTVGSEASEKYKVMERRLLRGITTPAMIATIAFGVALGFVEDQWSAVWLQVKTLLVFGLAGVHGALARFRRAFAADRRPASEWFFRVVNELPTLLFVAIVLLAVLRPF